VVEVVHDALDPRLDPYRRLTDVALRRQVEPEGGYFIAEGLLAIQALLSSPYPLRSALVLDRRVDELLALALPAAAPVFAVSRQVLSEVAGFDVHRGILALGSRRPALRSADLIGRGGLLVVLEGINDQENLGAIFRNAAAFGVTAVLLDPTCADPLYRRSVRVSLGHVLNVPFARLEPWPDGLGTLSEGGGAVVMLTPDPEAPRLEQVAATIGDRQVALVFGAERHGLSLGARALGQPARIAMASGVDSLNVAAASAVALHCFARLS
jgi:tRNA G18 (ribose-2'-O)-methylase SpoU